jgi:hypothetical protein
MSPDNANDGYPTHRFDLPRSIQCVPHGLHVLIGLLEINTAPIIQQCNNGCTFAVSQVMTGRAMRYVA